MPRIHCTVTYESKTNSILLPQQMPGFTVVVIAAIVTRPVPRTDQPSGAQAR